MDSYADWLRARDDAQLRALLAARPELITPVPADLTALGARAATPAAIARALDRLDRFALAVLETLLVLPQPAPREAVVRELTACTDATADDVTEVLERLRTCGLVWDDGDADGPLRTAPGLRRALPHPAGLGPPAAELLAAYPLERLLELVADTGGHGPRGFPDTAALIETLVARLTDPGELLEQAGPQARAALEQLAWGPPVGRVAEARRAVRAATAQTPIEHLLARGLLAATDDHTVTLPREVALYLRGGRLFRDLTARPPATRAAMPHPAELVARTAAGQALTVVRLTEDLLERWGLRPPAVLRSGGLGVRDLRAAAEALDVAEWQAALLIETAHSAGLLARSSDQGVDGEWLPTRAFDLWRLRENADRWSELAAAWLHSDRVAGLVGERDERDRVINALGAEPVRPAAPQIRRAVLAVLVQAGGALPAEQIRDRLAWEQPRRRGALRDRLVDWTLREAELLGLTAFGAPAPHARPLLEGAGLPEVAAALAEHLPTPVAEILIQADLTAVAPGPLVPELARELALTADVESTGGATVYRFTEASVRRALDAGRSAAELIELLTRHSATPLPQPLTYLIEDVARRHGRLRVGAMSSYVRADDPALLEEVMADRRAQALPLHRLAPTVLASPLPRAELLEALRGLGLSPVAESPEGGVVITRPDSYRADTPADAGPVRTFAADECDPAVIDAAVRALRAGDAAARLSAPAGEPPRSPSMTTVEELRQAAKRGVRVWIGYLDQEGRASSRIVEPISVDGGFLTGYDATRAAVHRFALHRITGVAELEDGE